MVRCKFVCGFKDERTKSVYFSPVYSGSKENEEFFKSTPGGQFSLYTVNEKAMDQFEMGKEYYIDFSPAN